MTHKFRALSERRTSRGYLNFMRARGAAWPSLRDRPVCGGYDTQSWLNLLLDSHPFTKIVAVFQ